MTPRGASDAADGPIQTNPFGAGLNRSGSASLVVNVSINTLSSSFLDPLRFRLRRGPDSFQTEPHIATISRAEVEDLAAKLTGLPPAELKKNLSDDAAKLMQNATLGGATVMTNPPGFTMGTTMNVAGIGPVQGRSVCLFGRSNAAFVHFYARQSDWANQASALQIMQGSFRRTSGQGVTISDKTVDTSGKTLRSGGFDWSRVATTTVGGAIIGAIIGAFAWLKNRATKS